MRRGGGYGKLENKLCKGSHSYSAPATCQRGMWPSVAKFFDFSREASKQDFDVKTKNTVKAKNNPTGHNSGHRSVPLLEATLAQEGPWAGRIPNSNPETKYGPKKTLQIELWPLHKVFIS